MAFEYRSGKRNPVQFLLDSSTAAVTVGMAMTITDATGGYVKDVDVAAEAVMGIAMQAVSSPSADGDASVLIDISTSSIYEVPPNAGTLVITENYNTCDVGADGITIDHDGSSTDDIFILTVDLVTQTALVHLRRTSVTGVA